MQHEPEMQEAFETDQITHYKTMRDHFEKEALRASFDNRQLTKQNARLQQRIAELEKQAAEPELIPPPKIVNINNNKE